MTESTNVSINLQSPNISTVVYAVQNDRSARHIVAQLRDGSAPWTPPAGAAPVIRYVKPDGTGGFYDADDNNNSAIVISGSKADMTIVEQALTVPGDVYMQLHFYAGDGTRLTSFAWILRVQQSVLNDATIVSSDYFNVLTAKVSQAVQAASAAAESAAEAAASAASISIPLPITSGGTDATTAAEARTNLGLGNVANKDLSNVDNVRQYSASNPPPYPVTSVNGQTGAVSIPTAESGTNYCKMPDGTLIQWGYVVNSNTGYTAVSFPVTFATDNYIFSASPRYSSAYPYIDYRTVSQKVSNSGGVVNFKPISSTGSYTTAAIADWLAIGRWK